MTSTLYKTSEARMALPRCDPFDQQALRQLPGLSAAVINSALRVARGRVSNG